MYSLGIDLGSTTAKVILVNEIDGHTATDIEKAIEGNAKTSGAESAILFKKYDRHFSRVREKCVEYLKEILETVGDCEVTAAISGSAGLGLANATGLPFIQEVYSTAEIINKYEPDTSCVIELGGEDAKIIFFDGGIDERMNGSCAGGTGAFIDQMATLLNISVEELDRLSLDHERIYPIASRCGVFAKTDIQPLLNQGARKQDIAASIYQAVVSQTIAGLAQGRRIGGKVLFLGGPLFYCMGLRERFCDTLELDDAHAIFPKYALYAVALGASMFAARNDRVYKISELIDIFERSTGNTEHANRLAPLFNNEAEYAEFCTRHAGATVAQRQIEDYCGDAYLGIDCGSTTTKLVLISDEKEILYTYYDSNKGNPAEIVREQLERIYALCEERIKICGCAVTGYGEELIKNAFSVDYGIVETIAHYTAAKYFKPDVDFILDIGGQDIKCFKIRNGAIDSIMLNEACSSGCGSFLETFAKTLGHSISDFALKGIYGGAPVDLGSRCTVFMNSSVKQSQKEGATIEDISAGLSISVVKNAIYKVIRATKPEELGHNIVVQGGTFMNDAVLRAFEREIGYNVIRPSIAGLMGAYGAALYAKSAKARAAKNGTRPESSLIGTDELSSFKHSTSSTVCGGCTNHCHLTVNTFNDGRRFISGNQCEKVLGGKGRDKQLPNLYEFKRKYLTSLKPENPIRTRGRVGFPLSLGMYELLPLWYGIFDSLGFDVTVSEMSTHHTYIVGQFSIPSDTACYPAKIMHGHVMQLIDKGVDAVFYPCLTYNINEKQSDNCYNCPVVAYYSELLSGNLDELRRVKFIYPYLNVNNTRIMKKELRACLEKFYPEQTFTKKEIADAIKRGFEKYDAYMDAVKLEGQKAIDEARACGARIMILAGRPYHIDSEICHGIDRLANMLGFAVVSEDSVCHLGRAKEVRVLNQWTYHARLYKAAEFACRNEDTQLVQLVSFGCGVDAITTDEVRSILEDGGKFYTQLKIDEITNLGAVKIRLRSLIGALDEKGERS